MSTQLHIHVHLHLFTCMYSYYYSQPLIGPLVGIQSVHEINLSLPVADHPVFIVSSFHIEVIGRVQIVIAILVIHCAGALVSLSAVAAASSAVSAASAAATALIVLLDVFIIVLLFLGLASTA